MISPHPGELLQTELTLRDWTVADLVTRTGFQPWVWELILAGRWPVSAVVAKALSVVIGHPPSTWVALQTAHDRACERTRRREPETLGVA